VPEPILPLSLFKNRTFAVTSAVGFIVGLSLFGAVTYLPLYLQIVKGVSPTRSGLQLTPLMLGLLVTSILSGQLITRWGKYRIFPIIGTAVVSVGMVLLSRLGIGTSLWVAALDMVVLGLGLGMVMQVLVLAVQNAVDYQYLGVATSGSTMFRSIGGAIGVSLFGAIFANRLHTELAQRLPANVHLPTTTSPVFTPMQPVWISAAKKSSWPSHQIEIPNQFVHFRRLRPICMPWLPGWYCVVSIQWQWNRPVSFGFRSMSCLKQRASRPIWSMRGTSRPCQDARAIGMMLNGYRSCTRLACCRPRFVLMLRLPPCARWCAIGPN